MELLDLCYDVLIRILEELDPEDLAACARCCTGFNAFIKENRPLFKTIYLKNFDDPRRRPSDPEPQWEIELPKIIKCKKILTSSDTEVKRSHFQFVTDTMDALLTASSDATGSSMNVPFLADLFLSPRNVDAFLCSSSLYARGGTTSQLPADTTEARQLSAKLHCFYGIPIDSLGRRSLSIHPYARAKVYDLRGYTHNTRWGPFLADGSERVDWEMVEAIMLNLGYNSRVFSDLHGSRFKPIWAEPFAGVVRSHLEYPLSLPMEPDIPMDLKDPYGISGDWMRIVCFLDYNDLYAFNFNSGTISPSEPRPPINTEEAIRHIIMCLKVTKIETPGEFDNQSLPIVHFGGSSRSLEASWDPNANSRIRGTVRLTPEGEVRWSTVSIFYGDEERWRSEGIQIGGLRSKRGVMGTWFDKDYDRHGPAGPTAFWKVRDRHDSDTEGSGEDSD